MKPRFFRIIMLTSVFVISGVSSAFATDPYVCDPSEDTHDCECPENLAAEGLDTCTETAFSSLIDASDASSLSSYVTATWDSTDQVYDVTIDAESMPANGVIKLASGAGQWDDLTDLHDFMETLLGQTSLNIAYDGDDPYLLPKMRIEQDGATHRFDTTTDEWAAENSHNLIYDAITNVDGEIQVGSGDWKTLFEVDYLCEGSDKNSYDIETDTDLTAEQCSDSRTINYINFSDTVCGNFPEACEVLIRGAQTVIETGYENQYGTTLHCVEGSSGIECDVVNGWITSERTEADTLDLGSEFFSNGNGIGNLSISKTDAVEALNAKSWANGVCSEGEAIKGSDVVVLQTRDGSYDSSDNTCDF